MNDKPMSYASLKSVFQRMEPNLRIQLSLRLPSIRLAERSVPMYIQRFDMTPNSTHIDGTRYCVWWADQNGRLGTWNDYDLTPDGFRDFSVDDKVSPGDVVHPQTEDDRLNRRRVEIERTRAVGEVKKLRICFEMDWGRDRFATQYLEYNRTLADAAKYMNEKLLGGRRDAIRVKYFGDSERVLRLPEGLQVRPFWITVRHHVEELFNAYKELLDTSALKALLFSGKMDLLKLEKNYNHPIVRSLKHLLVESSDGNWLEVCLNVKNEMVHFECGITTVTIARVIDAWSREGRPIGTQFSFGFREEGSFKRLLESYPNSAIERCTMVGCRSFPDTTTIPFLHDSDSEISMFCKECYDNLWLRVCYELYIIVTPKGHRHFWNVNFDDSVFK